MTDRHTDTPPNGRPPEDSSALVTALRAHFARLQEVRRGVCLLNAGDYGRAASSFDEAACLGNDSSSLPAELVEVLGVTVIKNSARPAGHSSKTSGTDRDSITRALERWNNGRADQAIRIVRKGIQLDPENGELHFLLGTLLTETNEPEEAELRFTQAATIDRTHADAIVNLALCCAMRGAPAEAFTHLQRAQARRPYDARIGRLLAQAALALQQQGHPVGVRAVMPGEESLFDDDGINELSQVIEAEPDFVDAFISIPIGQVDETVFTILLRTIECALSRQPEHAELYYHCGRVLDRLGKPQEAINANERAVAINPRSTRALIELGKLYQRTNRASDAADRLEQAVLAGAEYADVYFLLGNLYRDQGQDRRARTAYRQALSINQQFEDARLALVSLTD